MADSSCTVIQDQDHIFSGKAQEILTAGLIKKLYGIEASVMTSVSETGRTAHTVAAYGTIEKEDSD